MDVGSVVVAVATIVFVAAEVFALRRGVLNRGVQPVLVVQPKPSRQLTIYLAMTLLIVLWIALANESNFSAQIPGGLLATALLAALALGTYSWTRLIVTQSELIARDAGLRTGIVERSDIASIHRYSFWTVILDRADKPVLRIQPYYTLSQLKALASLLDVPLVDHRKRRSLLLG